MENGQLIRKGKEANYLNRFSVESSLKRPDSDSSPRPYFQEHLNSAWHQTWMSCSELIQVKTDWRPDSSTTTCEFEKTEYNMSFVPNNTLYYALFKLCTYKLCTYTLCTQPCSVWVWYGYFVIFTLESYSPFATWSSCDSCPTLGDAFWLTKCIIQVSFQFEQTSCTSYTTKRHWKVCKFRCTNGLPPSVH